MVLVVLAVNQVRTFMSGAASDVEPQSVTVVSGDDGKSAVISWISDKESISKVEYGTTAASLVLMSAETSLMTNHNVSLTSLRPSTTYYFRIRVGDEVFDNGGIPYSFKTKADSSVVVTPTPTIVLVPSASKTNTGGCNPGVDYNNDGIINSIDVVDCKRDGGVVKTSSSVTPTSTSVSRCVNLIDYNSDGIINSLDKVNCLQSQE